MNLNCRQQQQLTIHNQKQLKKTHSIFVEDDCYSKQQQQEYEYQVDNNNKKPPTMVTQHYQQPFKANLSHMQHMEKRAGQQSLEIPTRDEEDNKSQHSYRTISSSRRQSTEDSIDTDDEYFCYELRKLEELERIESERRSHMDQSNR